MQIMVFAWEPGGAVPGSAQAPGSPAQSYAMVVVMAVPAATCPRCGARYDLPRQRPGPGPRRAALTRAGTGAVMTVWVGDLVVHQCQHREDLITGEKAWRPARTVGGDHLAA